MKPVAKASAAERFLLIRHLCVAASFGAMSPWMALSKINAAATMKPLAKKKSKRRAKRRAK